MGRYCLEHSAEGSLHPFASSHSNLVGLDNLAAAAGRCTTTKDNYTPLSRYVPYIHDGP